MLFSLVLKGNLNWWNCSCLGFSSTYPNWWFRLHMSPIEYRNILKYLMMIPLFSSFKYKHDLVRCPFYVFKCAWISVKKETSVNFLTDPLDGKTTLRSVGVLMYGWVGGRHTCVRLTEVLPLMRLRTWSFTVGQATVKTASTKWHNMRERVLAITMRTFCFWHFWFSSTRGCRYYEKSSKSHA
jgi:hypothetical protein